MDDVKIGDEVRVFYENKSIKGFVKKIDKDFLVIETRKEYYIGKSKITDVKKC